MAVVAMVLGMASVAPAAGLLDLSDLSVEVSAAMAVPRGDFRDVAGVGFGVIGTLNLPVSDELITNASVGYVYFQEKEERTLGEVLTTSTQVATIPIVVGIRYYMVPSLFVGGEAGIHLYSTVVSGSVFGVGYSTRSTTDEFSVAPQIGFEMGNMVLTARYVIAGSGPGRYGDLQVPDRSYLGVRVGFAFGK